MEQSYYFSYLDIALLSLKSLATTGEATIYVSYKVSLINHTAC